MSMPPYNSAEARNQSLRRMGLVPSEHQECEALVEWMDQQGLLFSHVASETFTKSWKVKTANKLNGVRKGVPDYIIVIPTKPQRLLFIEMKRSDSSPSDVKPEQRTWIGNLNLIEGVSAHVCKSDAEARAVILAEMRKNKS